nr:Adenylate kinase domain containing protein [Haemonchus contortus]
MDRLLNTRLTSQSASTSFTLGILRSNSNCLYSGVSQELLLFCSAEYELVRPWSVYFPGLEKCVRFSLHPSDYTLLLISAIYLEFGRRVASFVHNGELIPDNIVDPFLLGEVRRAGSKLILNGFPRSMCQVTLLEKVAPLDLVVELKVPKEILIERLSKRLVHPGSGRTYNLDYNPPKVAGKDDITGEPLIKRDDDAIETVRHRLELHEQTENRVFDYYRTRGVGVEVYGETSSALFQAVSRIIDDLLKKRASG